MRSPMEKLRKESTFSSNSWKRQLTAAQILTLLYSVTEHHLWSAGCHLASYWWKGNSGQPFQATQSKINPKLEQKLKQRRRRCKRLSMTAPTSAKEWSSQDWKSRRVGNKSHCSSRSCSTVLHSENQRRTAQQTESAQSSKNTRDCCRRRAQWWPNWVRIRIFWKLQHRHVHWNSNQYTHYRWNCNKKICKDNWEIRKAEFVNT